MGSNMTVAIGGEAAGRDDPRYQEGLAHLQAGEWQEAIRCFQELVREHPGSLDILRALDEAQFKANLDATARIRAKRWIIPWRPIVVRTLIVLAVAVLAVQGTRLVSRQVAPVLAQAQERRRLAQLEAEGNASLEAGDLDAAEARYGELLAAVPDHEGASQGLERIAEEREIDDLYQRAVVLQEEGDYYEEGVELFTEILVRRPQYRDVSLRIEDIKRQLKLDDLFAQAEADYRAGRALEAVSKYEQLRELDVNYERDIVVSRLYALPMQLGRELIERDPPAPEVVSQALDYFTQALSLRPRSTEAALEQRLAGLYLEGQTKYHEGRWDQAIARLGAVHDQRPDYLGGTVTNMLYDAYIRSGDRHEEADDLHFAYEQYRKAADLPVEDTVLARGRMFDIVPRLTPTPTPTVTPTATPTPLPTPTPEPTPTPTPKPLVAYHNQIVFYSANPDQRGYWVTDPKGENRQHLGFAWDLQKQYNELLQRDYLSPDGRFRVYVTTGPDGKTPQVYIQGQKDEYGSTPTWLVTDFARVSYDPVWSPDGSRIAFVSQENGSDDVWIVNPDAKGARNLTRNDWEWDKRPSWSPDSRRIVFWSNRSGAKQIYVMDADGRNVRNISNTEWDEYDPLWIK